MEQPPKAESTAEKPASRGKGASRGRSAEERGKLADAAFARLAGDDPDPDGDQKPAPKAEADKPADDEPKEPAQSKPSGDALQLDEATKTGIAELLKGGKLKELAAVVGVDKRVVDASTASMALSRKRERAAVEAERRAEKLTQDAESIRNDCRKEYGAPHKAREQYDAGNFAEAAQWMAHVLGDDFATITRNVASATKGMDEKELKRFQKERELKKREAALEAREKRTQQERTEAQRVEKAVSVVKQRLADHPALKLKNGAEKVFRVLDQAFDEKTGRITKGWRQAGDEVLAEFEVNAKALGYTKGAPPAEKAAAPAPKPTEDKPAERRGKKPFEAPAGERTDASGKKRRGMTMEERAARAERMFQRSRI